MNIPAHGTAYWKVEPGAYGYARTKSLSWRKEKGTGTVMVSESRDVDGVQDVLDFIATHQDCDIYGEDASVYITGYRIASNVDLARIQTYLKEQATEAATRKAQDIEKAKKLLRDAGEL